MRTYGEAVDVRPARPDLGLDDADSGEAVDSVEPGQFLWRGRLYVVRAVLAHWVELGPWWTGSSSSGARPARSAPSARSTRSARSAPVRSYVDHSAVGEPEPRPAGPAERPVRSVARDVGAVEREVWRVEARAGRSSSVGVYDLVRDVPPPSPAGSAGSAGRPPSRWRLARALD